MIRIILTTTLAGFLFFSGCDSGDKETSAPPSPTGPATTSPPSTESVRTAAALREPIEMHLYERPTQALVDWYAHRGNRPTLVLYSRDPFLQPVPDQALKNAVELLAKQEEPDFGFGTASPVILPKMALSVALNAGLFSKVVWVIPTTASVDSFSVELLREQLLKLGSVSEEEAHTITATDGVFSGRVRGVPFTAILPSADYSIPDPAVLHFDLSYLQPFYKDGVKTPAYSLAYDIFRRIRERGLNLLDATFSYSQQTGDIPLGSRFLGSVVEGLFNSPDLLDQPLPPRWEMHRKALFLPNFFKYEEARDLYLQMEEAAPKDAVTKYGLYTIHRQLKEGTKALEYLDSASRIDPIYGLEYLRLADLARESGLPEKGMEMMQKASEIFPENPFIRLHLADRMIEAGRNKEAATILESLSSVNWSELYYPRMTEVLAERQDRLK